ncbi:hypothetical protein I4U23_030258 [Adineta vaga]|nr:hypothetical protein I4U23_030258 [Adineta vaga]
MTVAILVSLIIFPLFATFEVENRFHYALSKLQEMHVLIIQAFLCDDKMGALMFLVRASIIENLVHKALIPIQMRLDEAEFEPTRWLQRIFNRKHQHIINMTLQEQENFITSFMCHVGSLQLMIKNCSFNEYHHDFTYEIKSSLLHLSTCQSIIVSSLMSPSSMAKDDFARQIIDLREAFTKLRSAYIDVRLHRVEYVLQTTATIQSEDSLSHAYFLFHLGATVQLLTQLIISNENKNTTSISSVQEKRKINFKLQWPRLLSSLKCMIIIGIGSIFVLVPRLSTIFENGHLILITLCVTQGDTVGGALTTMKMRLMGTLLGAIWAYITYRLVRDDIYATLGILSPWIFIFSYLKLLPNWGYTATVASFTPVAINLARLSNGTTLSGDSSVLLRIEESFLGITLAVVLTLLIFPIFAIDLLKDSIQTTLKTCQRSVTSMHSVYDQLFHHRHSQDSLMQVEFEEKKIKSFVDIERSLFHRLINSQRTLVEHASLEPTLWWMNRGFSTQHYNSLVRQQVSTFNMLYDIDAALMKINEYSEKIEHMQLNVAGGHFLPDLHRELSDLSKQLSACFNLWMSYFSVTQTRFYRLFRQCIYSNTKLNENDLIKHQQCLIDLYQTIHRLQVQHQARLDRLIQHYRDRLTMGEAYISFVPYANNTEVDAVFIAFNALYYSTTQLTQSVLILGETIHTILELETTHLYRSF